jgi:hypothetical protein
MEGEGKLHDPQAGSQMAADFRNRADDFLADFLGQLREFGRRQFAEIGRDVDLAKQWRHLILSL